MSNPTARLCFLSTTTHKKALGLCLDKSQSKSGVGNMQDILLHQEGKKSVEDKVTSKGPNEPNQTNLR